MRDFLDAVEEYPEPPDGPFVRLPGDYESVWTCVVRKCYAALTATCNLRAIARFHADSSIQMYEAVKMASDRQTILFPPVRMNSDFFLASKLHSFQILATKIKV